MIVTSTKLKKWFLSYRCQWADVAAPEDVVVEELQSEVDEEAAPDRDVVEHRPVGGVKGNLTKGTTVLFWSRVLLTRIMSMISMEIQILTPLTAA